MLNSRALDDVAAALWRADSVDSGVPESVTAGRTRDAFDDQSESTKDRWRKFARHAAPAVLTASMPEDVKGLIDDLNGHSRSSAKHGRDDDAEAFARASEALASLSAQVEELTRWQSDQVVLIEDTMKLIGELQADKKATEASLAEANRIIAEKDKALEPFADIDGEGDEDFPDETSATLTFGRTTAWGIKLGDFRRARAARDRRAS